MSQPIIRIEHISKAYRVGVRQEAPDTIVGAVKAGAMAPWRQLNRLRRLNTFQSKADETHASQKSDDILWALDDVSFDVNEGDVVGLIGHNGAGKSTLLKILSRITQPTSGRVTIRGRVGSLLEVGTGFHPDLTGRDNIYMNGTILGMTKREVDSKFDEIVEFSGVERFLETPIKRYSSGMQVRLAFSVAAHLDPEILIVDEVLAVGDIAFQKKCIGKMNAVASSGRTVIFVSHNMAAVQALCNVGHLLAEGKVRHSGEIGEVCDEYFSMVQLGSSNRHLEWSEADAPGNEHIRLLGVDVSPVNGETLVSSSEFDLTWRFKCNIPNVNIGTTLELRNSRGIAVLHQGIPVAGNLDSRLGVYEVAIRLPNLHLTPGPYSVTLIFGQNRVLVYRADAIAHFLIAQDDDTPVTQSASVLHVASEMKWRFLE